MGGPQMRPIQSSWEPQISDYFFVLRQIDSENSCWDF